MTIKNVMSIKDIRKHQERFHVDKIQRAIDTGDAFKEDGPRFFIALKAMKDGVCFLPSKKIHKEPIIDCHGYPVPFREDAKPGEPGSLRNVSYYFQSILN